MVCNYLLPSKKSFLQCPFADLWISACLNTNMKQQHLSKVHIHATGTEKVLSVDRAIVTSAQCMGGNWCSFTRRGAVSVLVHPSVIIVIRTSLPDIQNWHFAHLVKPTNSNIHREPAASWITVNKSTRTTLENKTRRGLNSWAPVVSLYALHSFLCEQVNPNHGITLWPQGLLHPLALSISKCWLYLVWQEKGKFSRSRASAYMSKNDKLAE